MNRSPDYSSRIKIQKTRVPKNRKRSQEEDFNHDAKLELKIFYNHHASRFFGKSQV